MDCPKCGAENSEGAEFCSLCLSPFDGPHKPSPKEPERTAEDAVTALGSDPREEAQLEAEWAKRKRVRRTALLAALVAAVLVVGGAGTLAWLQKTTSHVPISKQFHYMNEVDCSNLRAAQDPFAEQQVDESRKTTMKKYWTNLTPDEVMDFYEKAIDRHEWEPIWRDPKRVGYIGERVFYRASDMKLPKDKRTKLDVMAALLPADGKVPPYFDFERATYNILFGLEGKDRYMRGETLVWVSVSKGRVRFVER